MKNLLFSFLLFGWIGLFAQQGTVRGFVYDQKTGEPIIFTTVYLQGTQLGAATDVNGFFTITSVPAGAHTIMITSVGYDSLKKQVDVKKGQIVSEKLYLKQVAVELDAVEISAQSQAAQKAVQMSVTKITPKQIELLPSIGGEADIAQYMQVLPGVVFTGDQGGQLYIRGGSPIQNKVLLDGMVIYNPFHSIGLFSVFETDIMRNADIYTGGFNAEYGGRISSIMDITTRDGNKNRLAGKVGLTTFGAKAILEGPLKKQTENSSGSSSFILTGKTSYLDKTSKALYTYADSNGLPFSFTDLYGKLSFNGNNGSKFNLFGFNYADRVSQGAISNLSWNTFGLGSNFVLVPATSTTLIDGNFAYSQYGVDFSEANTNDRSSDISSFNLDFNFTHFKGDNTFKYGFQILGFSTDFTFFNFLNRKISQEAFTTELSGYVNSTINKGKLVIDPGLRIQYYASLSTFSLEPRFGLKFNATDRLRFKLATGVYSQNLISSNADRDVVNLFNGFLSGPENLQDSIYYADGSSKERTHELQKAIHYIAGIESDLSKRLHLNVEGYYKDFTQLSNINRNKLFNDDADNAQRPDILKKDFIIETGEAYGVDVVLKYEFKRLNLWAVYSWAKSNRYDGVIEYRPIFDRRHNVNLVANYTFGKDLNWEFSARFNFGSGFPFTQTQGFYEQFDFADGINTDYTTQNGSLGIFYGDINAGRLPDYHRLDLNLSRKIYFSENSEMDINLGVTNLYNRDNIFYFDRILFERVNQLPILPSLGVNITF